LQLHGFGPESLPWGDQLPRFTTSPLHKPEQPRARSDHTQPGQSKNDLPDRMQRKRFRPMAQQQADHDDREQRHEDDDGVGHLASFRFDGGLAGLTGVVAGAANAEKIIP